MSKLIFLYDEEYRDQPITKMESLIRHWDWMASLRHDSALTIRFSSQAALDCLTCLLAEQALTSEVSVLWAENQPAKIKPDFTIEPILFPDLSSEWDRRKKAAIISPPPKTEYKPPRSTDVISSRFQRSGRAKSEEETDTAEVVEETEPEAPKAKEKPIAPAKPKSEPKPPKEAKEKKSKFGGIKLF
jgi:hypothetical protein